MKVTWAEVVGRDDLIGGDSETVEDGFVFRGPLSRIWIDGQLVRFENEWVARFEDGKWQRWHKNTFFVDMDSSPPQDIGQGRVHFSMFGLGYATIYPKEGSKLDPAKVEGLQLPI